MFQLGCATIGPRLPISFLDLYGLINAPVVSRGRYGHTREIAASLPKEVVNKLLHGVGEKACNKWREVRES